MLLVHRERWPALLENTRRHDNRARRHAGFERWESRGVPKYDHVDHPWDMAHEEGVTSARVHDDLSILLSPITKRLAQNPDVDCVADCQLRLQVGLEITSKHHPMGWNLGA